MRKGALSFAFFCAITAVCLPAAGQAALCGDVTGDGLILVTDALVVLKRAVDILDDDSCGTCSCDVNGSGGETPVTTTDALLVLKTAVGIEVELVCTGCSATTTSTTTTTLRAINSTAPNEQTLYLTANLTDSDGDGMTDACENKYGYDPADAVSFPAEPALLDTGIDIAGTGIGAYYEVFGDGIDIRWSNPAEGSYSLTLYNGSQQLYYGGHYAESASVSYSSFGLAGSETLTGHFSQYNEDSSWAANHPEFTIDLSTVVFPVVADVDHRIGYYFTDFDAETEQLYRDYLTRLFPLMYEMLGPPAETFNVNITHMGQGSSWFMITDGGRTFLSDGSYIPRLIAHELVHAWSGNYSITSDQDWNYDDALSGFEEGLGEGLAFELVHEYVRCYPNDYASLDLFSYRPWQYWSSRTTFHDLIKTERFTGAGAFWTDNGTESARYGIAASTVQTMVKANPDFMTEFRELYYARIKADSSWRPGRADIVDMWATVVPETNGVATADYLDALPVFQGRQLDRGLYIVATRRPYGTTGDQQFAIGYSVEDGRLWWGIASDQVGAYDLPDWLPYVSDADGYVYIDTQAQPFTVTVYDAAGSVAATLSEQTEYDRYQDGGPTGFGWQMVEGLAMEDFALGLYRANVDFTDFSPEDSGASEDFYFFGYGGLSQDKDADYVIMVGVDGVASGQATITIEGSEHSESISDGLAVFSSKAWPFDLEGKFPITVTDGQGQSRTYYRTLLEAGTTHGYYQQQFLIVDRNLNGIEDIFE